MTLEGIKAKEIRVLDEPPEGWVRIDGAMTAPRGCAWYSNGKSRFGGEYEHALVRIRHGWDDE